MQLNEYQEQTKTTVIYPDDKAVQYLILELASEIGEVAGKYKKYLRGDYGDYDVLTYSIALELGDVLWGVARLSGTLGYDLEQIAKLNLDKLQSRKEKNTLSGEGDNR